MDRDPYDVTSLLKFLTAQVGRIQYLSTEDNFPFHDQFLTSHDLSDAV